MYDRTTEARRSISHTETLLIEKGKRFLQNPSMHSLQLFKRIGFMLGNENYFIM